MTEDEMAGSPSNHHQLAMDGITNLMDMRLSKLQKLVMDRESLACCSHTGHHSVPLVVTGCLSLPFSLGQLMHGGVMIS